jgi:hypothetical protein
VFVCGCDGYGCDYLLKLTWEARAWVCDWLQVGVTSYNLQGIDEENGCDFLQCMHVQRRVGVNV